MTGKPGGPMTVAEPDPHRSHERGRRHHWGIENRLHWIRDVTFAEDLSQIRTRHGPAVMATLRNLAISLHRPAGATSIATACRTVSRHPNRVFPLLT